MITIASAGTSVSSVRTLEKNRVRQISQYGSARSQRHDGGVGERRDERRGEAGRADEDGDAAERVEAGRRVAEPADAQGRDQRLAAVRREEQRDHQRPAQPALDWMIEVRRERRQQVGPPAPGGVRRSVTVRIAFGGQRTDGVAGGNRSTRPIRAPT